MNAAGGKQIGDFNLFRVPCSLFLVVPCFLFLVPWSRFLGLRPLSSFPVPWVLFLVPCSLGLSTYCTNARVERNVETRLQKLVRFGKKSHEMVKLRKTLFDLVRFGENWYDLVKFRTIW